MQKSHFLKGNRPETEHPKPEETQEKQPLLKIEGKNHHADGRAIERLRENLLRRVIQIRTLFVEHIPQSETEFQFRYQLEKRQVEVTSHPDLHHEIHRLGANASLGGRCQIQHRLNARQDIRAIIVEAGSRCLDVKRQGNVTRFQVLRHRFAVLQIAELDVLASKMQRRNQPKRKILIELPLAKHTHRESHARTVVLGQPLCSRFRIHIPVVLQTEALVVKAEGEAVVEAPLVDERLVLHFALLRQSP